MNHILQLQADKLELEAKLKKVESNLMDFLFHLNSEKFAGISTDGSRKDWIATADVINWIRETKKDLN